MQNHILIHTGQKPHKCTCGMSFTRKKYLTVHIEYQQKKSRKYQANEVVHHQVMTAATEAVTDDVQTKPKKPEKPFHCMICLKSFTRKNNLKQHMLGHTNSKPFKCPDCCKAFRKKTNLKSHMSTHSGEKPHVCPICQIGFSRKSNLTKHILTHGSEKPYICGTCGVAFTQKKNLTSHVMLHTGNTPHKCGNCGKCFARKDSLTRHLSSYKTGEVNEKQTITCFVEKGPGSLQDKDNLKVELPEGTQVYNLFQYIEQRDGLN